MIPISPVITYSQFYFTEFTSSKELNTLYKYKIEDTILFLIGVRNGFSSKKNSQYQFDLVKAFFDFLPIQKKKRLLQLLDGSNSVLVTHTVVNRIIVDLFNQINYSQDNVSLNSESFASDVLDTLLAYNESQYQSVDILERPDTPELAWDIFLMQDNNSLDEVHLSRTSAPKHLIFNKFIKKSTSIDDLTLYLNENFYVNSTHELNLHLLQVFIQNTANLESKNTLLKIPPSEKIHQVLIKMEYVFGKGITKNNSFNVGELITKPFFLHSDGNLYLTSSRDFALIMDKIWTFFLYKSKAIQKINTQIKNVNDFLSFIGKEYYEKFLLLKIFNDFSKKYVRVLSSDDQYLPDLSMIVDNKTVYLIEIKSSSLNYRTFLNRNTQEFKQFIDENFALKKKGVRQLINNIRHLADKSNELYNIRSTNKLTIVPILIYTEHHLTKPMVNRYVEDHFKKELAEINLPFKEVLPVTMIYYEFFIENADYVKKKPNILKGLIRDYWRYIRKKEREYVKFKSTQNYVESSVSFDDYLIYNPNVYKSEAKHILDNMTRIFDLKGTSE
ncbi:hypothetical protein [Sphingobacterium paucimobilis]|uniref:Uncharacterized protein n=1 Tax=Sphingobacterium paucimobilis HER1398 TaxID=1346330 RepID=U2H635_9SPHI|nr:hypothetical protein [Sphingobacterium paucimobilis]ERJ57156.1 hypothetical protein M472_00105 [Sphingobacterium paucimobilis HER1398]